MTAPYEGGPELGGASPEREPELGVASSEREPELGGASSEREPEHGAAEATGHPAVDVALDGLARAAALPPAEQVSAYEAAHRALQQTLATIDQS